MKILEVFLVVKYFPVYKTMMKKNTPLFWFGFLREKGFGSIVIWDKMLNLDPADTVILYHARRHEILTYKSFIVRKNLRLLCKEEWAVVDALLARYFALKSVRSTRNYEEKKAKDSLWNKPFDGDFDSFECEDCGGYGKERDGFGVVLDKNCTTCSGWGRVRGSSEEIGLVAQLKEIQELLETGLITLEEAREKRVVVAKLLGDL